MASKKRKWPKILGITLLVIVLIFVMIAVGGYFYLRSRFGNTPEISLDTSQNTIVETTGGTVSGGMDDEVYTYLGIPYATVKERFFACTGKNWEGTFEATEYGAISPKQSFFGTEENQDNDCLNLNIWTNSIGDGAKRPVMVWYHGGGMTSGSANEEDTNGKNLAKDEDVVVVTVNHRLGVSAYLDLSDYGEKYQYSGNVGVLDMIASLRWISENIEGFGGDLENSELQVDDLPPVYTASQSDMDIF